jgi:short-subunit dehydrogenase
MGSTRQSDRFRGKVVVVTGASAGVGRATARAFAESGAHVCLIARDPEGLEQTRRELEMLNRGRIAALTADVADAGELFAAAQHCEETLGPIDIWVNNAMATTFSTVDEIGAAEFQRITEVTYLGYVYGTLAALSHMRERDRGTIVQVGSALAYRSIPLQSSYCGAKHAIRGFTDALRSELIRDKSGIAVTAVHLPAINTPQFDWARTHRRTEPRPAGPVYQPEAAARAILRAAHKPKREYWVGAQTPLVILGNMLMPGWLDRYLAADAIDGQSTGRPLPELRPDNLFTPVEGLHRTDGSFSDEARAKAVVISGATARGLALATVSVAAGLTGMAVSSLRRRRRHV